MSLNTLPFNPFPPSSDQKGSGGGGSYVLPAATADTLGGIKVGDNLTVEEDGTLNAADPYTLPIAADDTLGGIKVGDNLTVEEDGTLNAADPYTPPAYSTTPVIVGKWIDNRDIYRVVYDNIALTNNTEVVVNANFGSTKDVIGFNCITRIVSGTGKIQRPIQSLVTAGNDYTYPYVNIDTLNIIVHGNWTGEVATLIIDYVETPESNEE